jgi:hypothetical protein
METYQKFLIGLVIGAVIAGGAYYVLFADNGAHNPLMETSELNIRVESTHILLSANYTLSIDGENVESWSMGPSGYAEFTYTYTTPKTDGTKMIVIKVVATGGGFGTQTDSVQVLMGTSQNYSMTLRA